jgi:hypothetical protein
MITFDEAAVILDDLIEELPDGIYEKLNGGVNLIEDCKATSTATTSWACTMWTRWAAT